MSHQIAGQEVKGINDILKISVIYIRYFRYFTDISMIFYRYIFDILSKIPTHVYVGYTFGEISPFFDISLTYQ